MRSILHADLDAFYASVAQRDDPSLRGRPVVVGGGVCLAASYEARALGVRSAMGAREWRRLCPDAIVVPTSWEAYTEASRAVRAIFHRLSPVVQPVSIDEAFLDVTDALPAATAVPGGSAADATSAAAAEVAREIRRAVREEVGLPISVGVATTRAIAKVASNAAKPDGLVVVAPGEEAAFLGPLPVEALSGVGPATTRRLHAHGLLTVGQLATLEETALMQVLGVAVGRQLHAVVHARDPRPVRRGRGRRSFGAQSALGRRPRTPAELDERLATLVDRVTTRMVKAGRVGRTVTLRLRFGDDTRASRSRTLDRATASPATILGTLRALWADARELVERRGVTLVGITVSGSDPDGGAGQLELPLAPA